MARQVAQLLQKLGVSIAWAAVRQFDFVKIAGTVCGNWDCCSASELLTRIDDFCAYMSVVLPSFEHRFVRSGQLGRSTALWSTVLRQRLVTETRLMPNDNLKIFVCRRDWAVAGAV